MKSKLPTEYIHVISARVFIARSTDVISQKEMEQGFEIDRDTIRRYVSPQAREYSRAYQRSQYKRVETSNCLFCHTSLTQHSRCIDCTILLHKDHLHGHSSDGQHCDSCIAARRRAFIRA